MRIAIIGSHGYPYVYGGYETFVAELASRLAGRGHQPVIYCYRSLFKDRPQTRGDIQLVYVPGIERKTLSQFSHSFLATMHVVFSRADVVLYVNAANGPFGFLTKTFRKKTAINVDGLEWLRPKWKGLGARYFRLAALLATKLFDVVVTDSLRMAEIYRREFNCNATTIAYGADVGFSRDPREISQFGLVKDDYYLVVGRLVPDNNADLIVKGFQRAKTTRKLVVVGDVPYRDKYAESVRKAANSKTLFLGYIRDQDLLRELYCNAYAYVHGHEFGGTNPALLKALGFGCCTLALDTPFNREVLADERHGLYFTKDEETVCRGIERVERDKEFVKSKRESARSRVTESYTWEDVVEKYEELFKRMLAI